MRGVTLVKTWLSHFDTKADALREPNEKLGTSYQHGHLSRWEREEREPAKEAREEMLRKVMRSVLEQHGNATPTDVKTAVEKLR